MYLKKVSCFLSHVEFGGKRNERKIKIVMDMQCKSTKGGAGRRKGHKI
jgi:hypothetical protein